VPVRGELAAALADLARRQIGAAIRLLDRRRGEFRALLRALPHSDSIFALRRQQLDNLESRLGGARAKAYDQRHLGLVRLSHRLAQQSPHAQFAGKKQHFNALEQRLKRWGAVGYDGRKAGLAHLAARLAIARRTRVRLESERAVVARQRLDALASRIKHGFGSRLAACRERMKSLEQLLGSLGYHQVLARGFALVRDSDGNPLRRAAEVFDGASLDIEFADGHMPAIAGTRKDAVPVKRPASTGPRKREQGSLF
jgi:exodeoxyribonuclease VII large subunit